MSTFASPTPGLDLTMQNLANSTTIIQAMAYYQQSGGVGPDGVHSPRLKQWKRIGKVAVTLLNNRLIIPQEELKTLSVRLVEWDSGL